MTAPTRLNRSLTSQGVGNLFLGKFNKVDGSFTLGNYEGELHPEAISSLGQNNGFVGISQGKVTWKQVNLAATSADTTGELPRARVEGLEALLAALQNEAAKIPDLQTRIQALEAGTVVAPTGGSAWGTFNWGKRPWGA